MNTDLNHSGRNGHSGIRWETINIYTRTQAIADGLLVDVTSTAKEAGFRFPMAISAAVWQVIENIPSRYPYEDVAGRLWDVVWMARSRAGKCREGTRRFVFELILHRSDQRTQYTQLVCDCGPGDDGEPVLTIGFAEDF